MNNNSKQTNEAKIIADAKEVFVKEAEALIAQSANISDDFCKAVYAIDSCKGKLVFSGMGKAGLIAKKIAATFSSLGKAAFFLHPAEASHGDLGMVHASDLVFMLSKSGASNEVSTLLPSLKRIGVKVIGITCEENSTLAQKSDIFLPLVNHAECCGLGLAPTTSTTLMLALGDALAVSYLKQNQHFDERSFAFFHPGGSLGKQLRLVDEVMRTVPNVAVVSETTTVGNTLVAMTKAHSGAALIVDKNQKVLGIFSDGDLRRGIEKAANMLENSIETYMKSKPVVVRSGQSIEEAKAIMNKLQIGDIPVVDGNNIFLGMLCIKDV